LNEKTKHRAINIIHQADRNKTIVGKDPMGIAAAVLYIACLNVDEKEHKVNFHRQQESQK
jgi:transcription initiation factor TFIIB